MSEHYPRDVSGPSEKPAKVFQCGQCLLISPTVCGDCGFCPPHAHEANRQGDGFCGVCIEAVRAAVPSARLPAPEGRENVIEGKKVLRGLLAQMGGLLRKHGPDSLAVREFVNAHKDADPEFLSLVGTLIVLKRAASAPFVPAEPPASSAPSLSDPREPSRTCERCKGTGRVEVGYSTTMDGPRVPCPACSKPVTEATALGAGPPGEAEAGRAGSEVIANLRLLTRDAPTARTVLDPENVRALLAAWDALIAERDEVRKAEAGREPTAAEVLASLRRLVEQRDDHVLIGRHQAGPLLAAFDALIAERDAVQVASPAHAWKVADEHAARAKAAERIAEQRAAQRDEFERLARKAEAERDAALAECDRLAATFRSSETSWKRQQGETLDACRRIERERDEARAALSAIESHAEALRSEAPLTSGYYREMGRVAALASAALSPKAPEQPTETNEGEKK